MKTDWNLELLGKKEELVKERQKDAKFTMDFVKKWKGRKDYLSNPNALKTALDEMEKIYRSRGKEAHYYWLASKQNQADEKIRAKVEELALFYKNLGNEMQFFELSLGKVPSTIQTKFLKSPLLEEYGHYLSRLFATSKHHLTEEGEKIMTLKSGSSYGNWVKMTSTFLSKEEPEVLLENGKREKRPFEQLSSLISSENKKVRDDAAKVFNTTLAKHVAIAVEEMNSILADHRVDDMLRGFKRPDESRHLSDDIDSKTVDVLLESVSRHNSLAHRFYALKAKMLGQKHLDYHERNVPVGKISRKFSFGESMALVSKTFDSLDSYFSKTIDEFFAKGQIDAFPKKGKSGGAFCVYNSLTDPVYVLLNFDGKLRDVTTIAHEFGHAINNEFVRQKQNSFYFGTPLATAEVASTFMEDFVLDEIMKSSNEEERLVILMERLNDFVSSVFRQVACYRFEQELHKTHRDKHYLSEKDIGDIFQKHMRAYMGDSVKQNGGENWWVYWSHIRDFFYVYSYASGLIISNYMQDKVRKDKKFISEVKEFLSAGLSMSPKEIFRKMGIDISDSRFWTGGLAKFERQLGEAESLARKLGKI